MKKICRSLACAVIAVAMLFAIAGCSEQPNKKSNGMATAIGLGHQNCITEATVIVDGYGEVLKVQFDEIFPVNNVTNFDGLSATADKILIPGSETKPVNYYAYLHIGDKYFKGTLTADNKSVSYAQIGATSGAIGDLVEYCKTEEGVKWYYDSFIAGKMNVCKVDATGTAIGGVTLKDDKTFNTANGSMRKRYSKYWSTSGTGTIGQIGGLGFNGNMDMLENYLITYGFAGSDNIKLPVKGESLFNEINGITTGATLNADTAKYIAVAQKAYDEAIKMSK